MRKLLAVALAVFSSLAFSQWGGMYSSRGSGLGDALVADPLSQFAATTSAQLAGVISDELGSGKLIFSAGTLVIVSGKTLTVSETMTLTGTAAKIYTFPTTDASIARTDAAQTFTGVQTFAAPILGTPTSVALTNATVIPTAFCFAASDETTLLTVGDVKVTTRMPFAMTLTAIRGSLSTVATGATLVTVDVNEAGLTILSTKLPFDASESTTFTAATPPVISDSALADDAQITVDIDAVGNTTAGKGLKICLIGTKN